MAGIGGLGVPIEGGQRKHLGMSFERNKGKAIKHVGSIAVKNVYASKDVGLSSCDQMKC